MGAGLGKSEGRTQVNVNTARHNSRLAHLIHALRWCRKVGASYAPDNDQVPLVDRLVTLGLVEITTRTPFLAVRLRDGKL